MLVVSGGNSVLIPIFSSNLLRAGSNVPLASAIIIATAATQCK